MSRDTWAGSYENPVTLNRFSYAHNNPIMYTDPSGNCIFAGVDTVLCAALGGGVAGAIAGATIGAAYAKWMYHLAYTGRCGCEGQQLIGQYTEVQFMLKGAGMGAAFGAIFGALSATGTVVAELRVTRACFSGSSCRSSNRLFCLSKSNIFPDATLLPTVTFSVMQFADPRLVRKVITMVDYQVSHSTRQVYFSKGFIPNSQRVTFHRRTNS
jgi:hypothetical protein